MWLPAGRPPLFGRARELGSMLARLDAARDGSGGVVLVSGEPGIGKTRLLDEFASVARDRGWSVLAGHGYDGAGKPAFLPFIEVLDALLLACQHDALAGLLGADVAEIARLVPALRERRPDLPMRAARGQGQGLYHLFEAVAGTLSRGASAAPVGLLIILDDLHWADRSSLLLLAHLAGRLEAVPVLIAGAYRTTAAGDLQALDEALAAVSHARSTSRLALGPLQVDAVHHLVSALGDVEVATPVAAAVHHQTEGNPLFVGEVVRHLQARGLDLSAAATAGLRWGVPEGVRQTLAARFLRLPSETHRIVQAAALLGERIEPATLARVSDSDGEALVVALETAEAAGMIRADGHEYRFAHALVRETLIESLSPVRREHLHQRAAQAIESVHAGRLRPHLTALAQHYMLAGPVYIEPAIEYAVQAGDAAAELYAFDTVVEQWEAASALMDGLDGEANTARHALLLDRLATTIQAWGIVHYPRAIACNRQALRLHERLGDVPRAAQAHMRLAAVLSSNSEAMDLPAAVWHLQQAEPVLRQQPESPTFVNLLGVQSVIAVWTARPHDGLGASAEALAIAERTGNTAGKVHASVIHG